MTKRAKMILGLALLFGGGAVLAQTPGVSGAIAAGAWSISREVTQAEYRWIEQFGAGLRENMAWWGGFDLRVWQKLDPWLDWLLPCLTVMAIALIASRKTESPVQP